MEKGVFGVRDAVYIYVRHSEGGNVERGLIRRKLLKWVPADAVAVSRF